MSLPTMVLSRGFVTRTGQNDEFASGRPQLGYFDVPALDNYSHELNEMGTYISASGEFTANKKMASYYAAIDLGSIVEFYSEDGQQIWIGLVNKVSITGEAGQTIIGPWTDIANRVAIAYQGLTWNAGGVSYSEGDQVSEYAIDKGSVLRYGSMTKIVAGSRNYTDEEATRYATAELMASAYPSFARAARGGSGNDGKIKVSVECVGAIEVLRKNYWERILETEYVRAHTKLTSMITDPSTDLQFWFRRVFSELPNLTEDPSGTLGMVLGYEEELRTAYEILADDLKILKRGYATYAYGGFEQHGGLSYFHDDTYRASMVWIDARPAIIGYKFSAKPTRVWTINSRGNIVDQLGNKAQEYIIRPGDGVEVDGMKYPVESVSYSSSGGASINYDLRGSLLKVLGE